MNLSDVQVREYLEDWTGVSEELIRNIESKVREQVLEEAAKKVEYFVLSASRIRALKNGESQV